MIKGSSPFSIFKYRDFSLMWIGMLFSQIGTQMQIVGISWHVYQLTKSAFALGAIGLVGFLPLLLLSPVAGVLVDAIDKKKLMLINQVLLGTIALIFGLTTHFNIISLGSIYLIVFAMALVTIIDLPARQASIPSLVDKKDLIKAFNMLTMARQIASLSGPALAGFLIAFWGVQSIYFINAASFFILLIALFFVSIPNTARKTTVVINISSIKEGIHFVASSPILYATMLLDFFANFFAAATVIFPIFALQILHIGVKGLGLLYAAPAIGAIVTGLLLSIFPLGKSSGKILLATVIVYGLATIGFGISKQLNLSLVFLAISGASDMVSMVIRRTITQLVTPDYIRGRMNAINMVFFAGGPFLGEAEAGFAAAILGGPFSVILGGLGVLISVVSISICIPSLRNYEITEA